MKRGIETEKEMGKNVYMFDGSQDYVEELEHTVIQWHNPQIGKEKRDKN